MRWHDLWSDLDGQWEAAKALEFQAEVADRARSERAAVSLAERLVNARGRDVAVTTLGGHRVSGTVTDVAAQWLMLSAPPREHLVPVAAIATVTPLASRVGEIGPVERKLGLGHTLRALSRDRARVRISLAQQDVSGVIAVVGADYLELAPDAPATGLIGIPFAAIGVVSSS